MSVPETRCISPLVAQRQFELAHRPIPPQLTDITLGTGESIVILFLFFSDIQDNDQ